MFDKGKKTQGFMVEGYIVYEYFYYASEYIKQIDNTLGAEIQDDERDEDKREGDLLEKYGKRRMIKSKWINICQIYTQ